MEKKLRWKVAGLAIAGFVLMNIAACGGGGGGGGGTPASTTGVWDTSTWDNATWGP